MISAFISSLASAAHGVTKHLEVSIQTQDKILESQQESLKVQANMVQDNNALYQTVLRVKQIFDEFRYVMNPITKLYINGEYSRLKCMLFCLACRSTTISRYSWEFSKN